MNRRIANVFCNARLCPKPMVKTMKTDWVLVRFMVIMSGGIGLIFGLGLMFEKKIGKIEKKVEQIELKCATIHGGTINMGNDK